MFLIINLHATYTKRHVGKRVDVSMYARMSDNKFLERLKKNCKYVMLLKEIISELHFLLHQSMIVLVNCQNEADTICTGNYI